MSAEQRGYLAIDLGAGSGRVMLGVATRDSVRVHELHRFHHAVRREAGHDRWPLAELCHEIEQGLHAAARQQHLPPGALRSVGVDGWGVDYGLLDGQNRLLANPVSYRDHRTDGVPEELCRRVPRAEVFRRTGIQHMPINTSVQLLAQVQAGEWPPEAARLLMVPDLVHHWLCGSLSGEVTNASTTQLLDARTRAWDLELVQRIGVPAQVLPTLVPPGTRLGTLRAELARRVGLPPLPVVAPATHDTASAVAGTPLREGWAYLSSGTWSLLGVETEAPVLSEAAAEWNVTNEAGVCGTNRLLKNVMGLWLLEACRERWSKDESAPDRAEVAAYLRSVPTAGPVFDVDDPRFLNPPDMPAAIAAWLRERGLPVPADPFALSALVLRSLARRYAEVVARLQAITGSPIRGVHIVGGGSKNEFLNQATAEATGLPVRAGPVEATALGNVLVQAMADGLFPDLAAARAAVGR